MIQNLAVRMIKRVVLISTFIQLLIDIADPHPDLSSVTITVDQVNNILQKLDVNKSRGPDDISPILLKCVSHYLSPSLFSFFNRSLRDGVRYCGMIGCRRMFALCRKVKETRIVLLTIDRYFFGLLSVK